MLDSIGIAGEFRCVITKKDGGIKKDTGFIKNLITDSGLDFFSGIHGTTFTERCFIGSGNSEPNIGQIKLDTLIGSAGVSSTNQNVSYTDRGDNLYRSWEESKYTFTGLNNANISEVGLGSSSVLYTRALVKDSTGAATTITVLAGETLEIYYRVHKVISTLDKSYVVNMLDGVGGSVPFNVVFRPANIGKSQQYIVKPITTTSWMGYGDSELTSITSSPRGETPSSQSLGSYTNGSFKRVLSISFSLSRANGNIRNINSDTAGFIIPYQIRFGSVDGDLPVVKTDKEILTIPLEISWGRYEGVL